MANQFGVNTSEWVPMPLKYGPPLPERWNILWPWVSKGPALVQPTPETPTFPTIPSITIPGTNISITVPTPTMPVIPGAPVIPGTPPAPSGASYTLTATVSPMGTGIISPPSGNYAAGTTVTLLATPAAGYTFTGWSGDASGVTPVTTIDMNSNKTVRANFSIISGTEPPTTITPPPTVTPPPAPIIGSNLYPGLANITFVTNGAGTFDKSNGAYSIGDGTRTLAFKFTPAAGYYVTGFTTQPASSLYLGPDPYYHAPGDTSKGGAIYLKYDTVVTANFGYGTAGAGGAGAGGLGTPAQIQAAIAEVKAASAAFDAINAEGNPVSTQADIDAWYAAHPGGQYAPNGMDPINEAFKAAKNGAVLRYTAALNNLTGLQTGNYYSYQPEGVVPGYPFG